MKKTSYLSYLLFFVLVGMIFFETSCDNAKTPVVICNGDPTYDNEIAPIINTKCAIAGCHISGTGTPGVFQDYDGMLPYLNTESNSIKDRVVETKDMPLGFSLSDTDLELIRCWVEGGYLEN